MPNKILADTIFHEIIRKEIPANIVYEDSYAVAITDINPVSPSHLLVIPKKTIAKISEASEDDKFLLGHMLIICKNLAQQQGLDEGGYRIVINCGEQAGQTVFQLHMHLLGGRSFSWPPG